LSGTTPDPSDPSDPSEPARSPDTVSRL